MSAPDGLEERVRVVLREEMSGSIDDWAEQQGDVFGDAVLALVTLVRAELAAQAATIAALLEIEAAARTLLDVERGALSAAQCEVYGVPFTPEVAMANVATGKARERLRTLLTGRSPLTPGG